MDDTDVLDAHAADDTRDEPHVRIHPGRPGEEPFEVHLGVDGALEPAFLDDEGPSADIPPFITTTNARELYDLRPGETMFWVTDIGWMMGPWEILGVLFHRGTVVLLDGTLDHPGFDRLFRIVERHRVTHLGLTPTRVRQLAARQGEIGRGHDLSSIRVLGSTGEPWDEASYLWAFHNLGRSRCPIVNISGGTAVVDAWYHLVGVYDGADAVLYVNGQEVDGFPVTTQEAVRAVVEADPNQDVVRNIETLETINGMPVGEFFAGR